MTSDWQVTNVINNYGQDGQISVHMFQNLNNAVFWLANVIIKVRSSMVFVPLITISFWLDHVCAVTMSFSNAVEARSPLIWKMFPGNRPTLEKSVYQHSKHMSIVPSVCLLSWSHAYKREILQIIQAQYLICIYLMPKLRKFETVGTISYIYRIVFI